MKAHECSDFPSLRVSFLGPFTHHDVVIDGWQVPFLQAQLRGEDRLQVVLDGRLGIDLSSDEAERLLPFVAHAIAVALGYGGHPNADMTDRPERIPHAAPRRVVEALPERNG
jgi:hypothetical protein